MLRTAHFRLRFTQTSPVFRQVGFFRTNRRILVYNPLTGRGIASGSRDFPDEEGTESEPRQQPGSEIEMFQRLPR